MTLLRRTVIVGTPLALVVFSLAHGLDWIMVHGIHDEEYDAFIQYIVDIRGRWLAVHLVGLVLFPLLGLALWWMLPPARIASRISQIGLAIYMLLYMAFDAVAGIGGAVLANYRETLDAAEQPIAEGAIWQLMGESPVTGMLAEVATYGWEAGILCASIALWQDRGLSRGWRIALPLLLGGGAFAVSHFPPYGAVAGGFLSIAAWQFFALTPAQNVMDDPVQA